jgi:hypothetical protein
MTECREWQGYVTAKGYGKSAKGLAHRVAWESVNGPIPKGMLVCHRCDNRRCVNPEHLFLGTPADNSADMVAKGRQCRGQRRSTRLADADVAIIKWCLEAGVQGRKLAALYSVSEMAVSDIKRGATWKHVQPMEYVP